MSTWILLRGLTREARHWGDFPQELSRALGDANVIALDLPGNGVFNAVRSPSRIEGMTDFCRGELVRRGLPPPYRLLAISLGGMVATDWATRYADEIEAAVLINTSMRPFSPMHHRLRLSAWPKILSLLLPGGAEAEREKVIFSLTSNLAVAPEGLIDQWTRIRQSHPVSASSALRQLIAAARFRVPAIAPRAKVLVLGSANDRLVDVRCSMALAHAWVSDIVLHPVAGHDLPLDEGKWVIAEVAEFHKGMP